MSSIDPFKPALDRAFSHALHHLSSADSAPVNATADLAALRARFAQPLPEHGTDPAEVIDNLVRECEECKRLGIAGVILFGIPGEKDEVASGAYAADGITQRAIRARMRQNRRTRRPLARRRDDTQR